MKLLRIAGLAAVVAGTFAALPASAQFYFKSPEMRGAVVSGAEPGIVAQTLPDATPDELKAALTWNLRAGLNVAALQCGFAPYLLTLDSYNQMLGDHGEELAKSYAVLTKYFVRTAKGTKAAQTKAGQTALDQYGTRVYSSFSTVGAQLTFCQAAGAISQAALFTPRGSFGTLAQERMRELRNSLVLAGEQRFPQLRIAFTPKPLRMDAACWKKGLWQTRKCGVQDYGGI